MASIKLSTIRERFTNAIDDISGMIKTYLPYDVFGRTPNSIAHKAYSVGIGGSNANDERQRASTGCLLSTDVDVKMSYRIRPLDQLTDVDAAMDLENDIIIAILDRTNGNLYPNLHIRFESSQRAMTDSGEYMISTLQFQTLHYIPLN